MKKKKRGGGLTSEGNGVDPVCQISHRRRSSRLIICSLGFEHQLIRGNNFVDRRKKKTHWK